MLYIALFTKMKTIQVHHLILHKAHDLMKRSSDSCHKIVGSILRQDGAFPCEILFHLLLQSNQLKIIRILCW